MLIRVITSIVLLPILFFVVIKGGVFLYGALMLVSLLSMYEFYTSFKTQGDKPRQFVGYGSGILIASVTYFRLKEIYYIGPLYLTLVYFAWLMIRKKASMRDFMVTLVGIIYIPMMLNFILRTSLMEKSMLIWMIFVIAWGTDTFAYFSGYFLGKNKLIPEVSPKKTVEGFWGGVIGSALSTMILGYILGENIYVMMAGGIFGSMISQLGDLFASYIKRILNIKDYGNIMPGHGGVLDRFDSIIFTAPFVYYFSIIFLK